jgi:hypothetical protein
MKRKIVVLFATVSLLIVVSSISFTLLNQCFANDDTNGKSAPKPDARQAINVTLDSTEKTSTSAAVSSNSTVQKPKPSSPSAGASEELPKRYYSQESRPIDVHVFGNGAKTVLIMGGVHGNEKSGVLAAKSLLAELEKLPASAFQQRIVVMPLVNPDGYAQGRRQNVRGIDLNRNFPETGFSAGVKSKGFQGGKKPASEPETQAVMDVVTTYKPYLIISFHAPLSCLNYSGPSLEIAKQLSKLTNLPVKSDIGYPTPGSMGNYYGCDQGVQVITFELPNMTTASPKYCNAVLQALGLRSVETVKESPPPVRKTVNRIVVCKSTNVLYAYDGSQLIRQYAVSTGKGRSWTPEGTFKVTSKTDRVGGELGTRWIGLNVRGKYRGMQIGIHGTNSPQLIGKSVSHGCVRLRNADVEELYALTSIGAGVEIVYEISHQATKPHSGAK